MRVLFVGALLAVLVTAGVATEAGCAGKAPLLMVCLRCESFFVHDTAETMLARVLVDEPEWEESLRVEPVELATGG